jgi:uncharacterized protein (DUF736 family)
MAEPSTTDILYYIGMTIGAVIAGVLVRLGWKKAPTPDTEVAISGQAQIIDTGPIKTLLGNVDLLTLQLQKAVVSVDSQNAQHVRTAAAMEDAAASLKRVADAMSEYLAVQLERQQNQDLEDKIRAELRREMEAHGEEPATQPARKR